jgi:transcriptional regulator with XRE-family HTH domain
MMNLNSNSCIVTAIGFGERIKNERQRLKLSQAEFAELGGVSRQSQANYESEHRVPDLNYLSSLCDKVDVMYILTGSRGIAENVKGIGAPVFQAILAAIESWAKEGRRQLTDEFRAELVALFFQQVVTHGKIDADLIKTTLRVVK